MLSIKNLTVALFLLFTVSINSFAVNYSLSPKAEISIITCGPGKELYSAFGHSAFRVRDRSRGIDYIFNYGTFDFNKPNFYTNFAKGNLEYFLSIVPTGRFIRNYHADNRWVKAQVLDLTQEQKQQLFDFLRVNALDENKYYIYDYLNDNCSTKINDVINEVLGDKLIYPDNLFSNQNKSYRELMHSYLDDNPWGELGIDLCLGSKIDLVISEEDYLFLPDNIFTLYENTSKKDQQPIIKNTVDIITPQQNNKPESTFLNPFIVFSIISIGLVLMTKKRSNTKNRFIDFGIYFITGVIGVLLLCLWFGTNHTASQWNYNILWAFPTNFIISFVLLKKKRPQWLIRYNQILLVNIGIILILWAFKIQMFPVAIIPILILITLRSISQLKN